MNLNSVENDITVQVDVKSRELPYLIILKSLFEIINRIEFSPVYQDPVWLKGKSNFIEQISKKTRLLITPSYNSGRTHFTLAWKYFSKAKLVHWHSEQLIDNRFYNEKLNLNVLDKYLRDVDFHIVWGEQMAELLVNKAGVDPSRIYITGCPKFDKIKSLLDINENYAERKKIVFVSDFSLATMSDAEYGKMLKRFKYSKDFDLRGFYLSAYQKFIKIILQVAKKTDNHGIVFRPHPGEKIEAYSDILNLPNIEVNQHDSFDKVIKNADLVVQFLSTSFFESYLAGKNVYCLDLADDYSGQWRDYFKYYRFIKPDEFIACFDSILEGQYTKHSDKVLEGMNYLFSTDLGPSIPRTYFAIQHILSRAEGGWSNLGKDKFRVRVTKIKFLIKKRLATMLYFIFKCGAKFNVTNYVADNFYGEENGFTDEEIRRDVEKFKKDYGEYIENVMQTKCKLDYTKSGIKVSV